MIPIDQHVMDIIESIKRSEIGDYGCSTLLEDDMGFTENDIQCMVDKIKDEFNIEIMESEIWRMHTVGDVINIIKLREI